MKAGGPAEISAEIIQATREVGQEGVETDLSEASIDVDGLSARRQRLLAAAEIREAHGGRLTYAADTASWHL
jgi:hypothetical protein